MNRNHLLGVFILACLSLVVDKSYSCPPNVRPIAVISGCPKYVYVGQTVYFDGSNSYDPDGYIVAYQWNFPSQAYDISGQGTAHASCKFTDVGTYTVKLWVKDNDGEWSISADYCTVEVSIADIVFTVADAGSGQLKISYTTPSSETVIRSIALKVILDDATIQDVDDIVTFPPVEYNCFMDYAYEVGVDYTLGTGHPLAQHNGAGVPDFPVSTFSINMACFDESGNQAPGPPSSENLITLQLYGTGSTIVTVGEDTLRSSFSDNGLTVNLPQKITVTLPSQ